MNNLRTEDEAHPGSISRGTTDAELKNMGSNESSLVACDSLKAQRPASDPPALKSRSAEHRDSEYVYGLDLVRFVSALSVAAFHLTWQTNDIQWLMPAGWVGVQVFFVISGYVIANSAFRSKVRKFVVGRFLRLYPAAWCAALITIALVGLAPAGTYTRTGIHTKLTVATACDAFLLICNRHITSAYWTLGVEIAFYAVVGVLIYRAMFDQYRHVQVLLCFLILWNVPFVVGPTPLRILGFTHAGRLDVGYGYMNMTLLRHGCFFGLGMLLWLMKEKRLNRICYFAGAAALPIGWTEIWLRARELARPPLDMARIAGFAINASSLTFIACAMFTMAVAVITLSVRFNHLFPRSAKLRRTVRLLGLTTYPLYLLHESVGGFSLDRLNHLGVNHLGGVLISLACATAISALVARYCEPALRNALRRIVGQQPSMSPVNT